MAREHAMKQPARTPEPPRILLVEDDPASGLFLATALEAMPATVACAASVADAMRLASDATFDLWLVDANLPDGNGAGLLQQLRAREPGTPALAHTASRERAELDALVAAGFLEVLVKPLPAMELQAAVRRVLGQDGAGSAEVASQRCGKPCAWDDDAARTALGSDTHVHALRSLFLAELPLQRDAVLVALRNGDSEAAAAQLHRLQGSCGFVGATRLALAVAGLRQAPASELAQAHFAGAVDDLLIEDALVEGVSAEGVASA